MHWRPANHEINPMLRRVVAHSLSQKVFFSAVSRRHSSWMRVALSRGNPRLAAELWGAVGAILIRKEFDLAKSVAARNPPFE